MGRFCSPSLLFYVCVYSVMLASDLLQLNYVLWIIKVLENNITWDVLHTFHWEVLSILYYTANACIVLGIIVSFKIVPPSQAGIVICSLCVQCLWVELVPVRGWWDISYNISVCHDQPMMVHVWLMSVPLVLWQYCYWILPPLQWNLPVMVTNGP